MFTVKFLKGGHHGNQKVCPLCRNLFRRECPFYGVSVLVRLHCATNHIFTFLVWRLKSFSTFLIVNPSSSLSWTSSLNLVASLLNRIKTCLPSLSIWSLMQQSVWRMETNILIGYPMPSRGPIRKRRPFCLLIPVSWITPQVYMFSQDFGISMTIFCWHHLVILVNRRILVIFNFGERVIQN